MHTVDPMIYLKMHSTDNGAILAMCDSDLVGKVLEEGNIVIDLKNYSEFYVGSLTSKDDAKSSFQKEAIYSANIVGKESVEVALAKGIVLKGNVKRIMDVPYANAFRVKER